MKPEAMPTPFDITPLHGTAYTPALNAWMFLLVCLLVLALAYFYLRARERPRALRDAQSYVMQTRASLAPYVASRSQNRQEIRALCLLMRRYLSSACAQDCTAMDWNELKQVASAQPRLSSLVSYLCTVEDLQYAPQETMPVVAELAGEFSRHIAEIEKESA